MLTRFVPVGAFCVAVFCVAGSATAQPYQDVMVFSGPASGANEFIPSGAMGPTALGEIHIVREQVFDTSTGPPIDVSGGGPQWGGLNSSDIHADGLFAQSIFVRVGPVSDCSSDIEAVLTLDFGSSAHIVGVVTNSGALAQTDDAWGVGFINYSASSRGYEGSDSVSINNGHQVFLGTEIGCTNLTDEARILVDWGTAFPDDASILITVHQDDCDGEPCGMDVNVGGLDGNADPDPEQLSEYSVSVPLTPAAAAASTPEPVINCPVTASSETISGSVAGGGGVKVRVFAVPPTGDTQIVGETLTEPDGSFSVTVDPGWPEALTDGWTVTAQAIDEAGGLLPSAVVPLVAADSDCDGTADSDDCAPADPTVHPGALEVCDEVDNDCDGATDEDGPDADNDNVADCADDCLDADGDKYGVGTGCLGTDCLEGEAVCNAECVDVDSDKTVDCLDACVDVDGDGYGEGKACPASDCLEGEAACNAECVDVDNDQVFDCMDPCIDADADGFGVGAVAAH